MTNHRPSSETVENKDEIISYTPGAEVARPVEECDPPATGVSDSDSEHERELLENNTQVLYERATCAKIKVNCWYIPVTFGKCAVKFLVDSGSEVTLIRKDIFYQIPSPQRSSLEQTRWKINAVDGGGVRGYGSATVQMLINGKSYSTEILVADITSPGVLGMNFLQRHNVSTNFSKGEFTIDGAIHFLERETLARSFQVTVARTVHIPPYSESIVPMRAMRAHVLKGHNYVLQPLRRFGEQTGAALGSTLVKSCSGAIPALVVNPTPEPLQIREGLNAAICVPATALQLAQRKTGRVSDARATPSSTDMLPEHLERMLGKAKLSNSQLKQARSLLHKYSDVFLAPDGELGKTAIARHRIDLNTDRPLKQRFRRAPVAQQEVIDQEVQRMLDKDIIEPCDSPWASPVVMVRKKDGSWRFCVDYRKLNELTLKDSYPLPHIDDTFDTLAGAQYFCALDLASGYWQVEMEKRDKAKTAFVTKQGLYQFKVMPFGLCNAPATFERLMEMVLKGYLWKRCMVYIDDVIVFGESFDQTLENLSMVLERIRAAGLTLKPKKCELFTQEILYLGFMVTGQGIRPDPSKIKCVQNWPRPCGVGDVRSFLGFASYHRRFVKDFAQIARPLTVLTLKNKTFEWGPSQEHAFTVLKDRLCRTPVLDHPRTGVEFILDTDASGFAIGGVLSQKVDGVERVIAYASTALSASQINYCTTHRELLAVVRMIQRFRHYLWGRKFTIRSDHSSLRWLLNYKDADGMLARWLAKLQEFDFHIEHRPGRFHGNADGLSRCHKCKNKDCPGSREGMEEMESSTDSDVHVKMNTTRRVRETKVDAPGCSMVPINAPAHHTKREPAPRLQAGVPDLINKSVLSRRACAQTTRIDKEINALPWLSKYNAAELRKAQRVDTALSPLILALEQGVKPTCAQRFTFNEETQSLASRWDQLALLDGFLYRKIQKGGRAAPTLQLVVPRALRVEILHQLHDLRVAGHLGVQRTVARVQQRFYWPGCALDVSRWCAACPQCASRKGKPTPGRAPLTPVITGAPFDRVALDILDTHKITPKGYRYILVLSDYFTKWTDAFPLRRHTARAVAEVLVNRFIVYHGVPKQIHSDQGAEFESALFQELVKMLGSTKIRTTPYRPQSDGQVERFN